MNIAPEALGYWYLRLNGFLTIPNFVVHPDHGRNQRTDVDVLGVRFPYRRELLLSSVEDHSRLPLPADTPYVVLAEVKASLCSLNGPWTKRHEQNMERVLCAVGIARDEAVERLAERLYDFGIAEEPGFVVSLLCLGAEKNTELETEYPSVPQVTWPEVLRFIHRRFTEYERQKVSHPQWDSDGQNLWNCVFAHRKSADAFIAAVRVA